MGLLTYLRLKLLAVCIRLITRLRQGAPQAHPDRVLYIKSRNSRRKIKIHVYQPSAPVRKRSPVLINLHSSGFIIPLHGSDDKFCRHASHQAGYTVLDVQYRLSPENRFPAALNDVEDVVKWVLDQPDEFDHNRLAISGFSAGGTLALVAASIIFPGDTFRSVLAFYPPTDLATDPSLKKAPDSSGKPIPAFLARLFNQCYIPSTVDPKDPRVSPSFASVDGYPKNVYIVTAARDTLALEAEALAARIVGRNVVRKRMEKCDHGWDKHEEMNTVQEEAKDKAYSMAVEILRL
jgi:acetyl esterase/lipase